MAKCLLVAATANEIAPFLQTALHQQKNVDVLVTGVGMVATAFALGKQFALNTYDFAINVGIAGAVSRELVLGELVFVERDALYELGAEEGTQFLSIEDLGFGKSVFSAGPGMAKEWYHALKKVTGITVNTVHGNDRSIQILHKRTSAETESMEGAAFYYACEQFGLSCMQVRSISNYVEKRDREKWEIGLAIEKLNDWLIAKVSEIL